MLSPEQLGNDRMFGFHIKKQSTVRQVLSARDTLPNTTRLETIHSFWYGDLRPLKLQKQNRALNQAFYLLPLFDFYSNWCFCLNQIQYRRHMAILAASGLILRDTL